MQKRTATKVVIILDGVNAWLMEGRPRKLPGKPRSEAVTWSGKDVKPSIDNMMRIGKVSLVAAFRITAESYGYSKYVRRQAEKAFIIASSNDHLELFEDGKYSEAIRLIDDEAWDTRWLSRDARRAARQIEKRFLAAS